MSNKTFSRRNFLKLGALSLSSLAFSPLISEAEQQPLQRRLMRVGSDDPVVIRSQPSDKGATLYQRYKDDLLNVYYDVESPEGPSWNPLWYKVWGGYVHSGHLVEVDTILNEVASSIHVDGQLGEITVPYTRAYRYTNLYGWVELSRLYYQSVHWIWDIITGPDGAPWYELEDELSRLRYAIPAEHMRLIPDQELTPIHPDASGRKWIEVSLTGQQLTAYEGSDIVLQTKISSGLLTQEMATPAGDFRIESKYASKHMGDGDVTADIHAYELMGVPWNCFFVLDSGIATHGTYWHNNFGIQMSHGCVNMRNAEAKWLFRWAEPAFDPHLFTRTMGYGTPISVV